MRFLEILIIAVGLSMDAFAVSIGKGLSCKKAGLKEGLLCGVWFGGFQALMPLIGWLLGSAFAEKVQSVDHWIAFILLAFIGGKMIWEAFGEEDSHPEQSSFSFKTMLVLAVATSIDALAAGVTFSFLGSGILAPVVIIGCTTFIFSVFGLMTGKVLGCRFHKGAEIFGGSVLILIGLKILIEHLLG